MPKHTTVKKMIRSIKSSKPTKPSKPTRGDRTAKNKQRAGYGKRKK